MMAHVKGSGALAYPEQDPRELRADIVRSGFDRICSAFGRYVKTADEYRQTFADPHSDEILLEMAWRTQRKAFEDFGLITREVERTALELADSSDVPVIHDRGPA